MTFRRYAPLAVLLLAGCSYFSQTVEPDVRAKVLDGVQVGMPMETAESHILSLGFQCSQGHGSFIDEHGDERVADHFLSCVRRPGRISFACENRDEVYVIPNRGVVDEIHVTRGPSCITQ